MSILISAGHSTVPPIDPGAVGNGYKEAELALDLRDRVAAELRSRGETVIEDGSDGVNEPLKKALVLARQASTAVEFHWNAGPPTATGIEVLSKPNKKALAQKLAGAINAATGIRLRGDRGWKADNSGQHHRLAFCEAGGLIVEVCFISNASDLEAYIDNKGRVVKNLADALSAAPAVTPTSTSAEEQGDPTSASMPPNTYTVQPGDSLWKIAGHFGTSVAAIRAANPQITDPDAIRPGMVLRVKL